MNTLQTRKCFLADDSAQSVDVYTFDNSDPERGHNTKVTHITSDASMQQMCEQLDERKTQTRLYILHQNDSHDHINITRFSLQQLCKAHTINPIFLKLFSAFYFRSKDTEMSWCPPFLMRRAEGRFEYGYVMKFAERNGRVGFEPWSIRQLAFYHQLDYDNKTSIYVLLVGMAPSSSVAAQRMIELFKSGDMLPKADSSRIDSSAILLHSYIDNWRDYIEFYEGRLENLANKCFEPGSIERRSTNPKHLEELYFLQTCFLPLRTALPSLCDIILGLRRVYATEVGRADRTDTSTTQTRLFEVEEAEIAAYLRNLNVIMDRWSATAELMSSVLTMRHQSLTWRQSNLVMGLTKLSVKDSASIHVITVITLLYLSFTLVASIMDIPFIYRDSNDIIRASIQLWIYPALSIPLTLASILYWRLQLKAKRREQDASLEANEKGKV